MDRKYIKLYKKYLNKYLELKGGTYGDDKNRFDPQLSIKVYYDFKDEDYDQFIKDNIDIDAYLKKMYQRFGKRDPNLNVNFRKAFPFYFVYILKIEFEGSFNKGDRIKIDNSYIEKVSLIDGDIYIHFFHFGATNSVKVNFEKKVDIKNVHIHEVSYKNGDSFMIGKTKPLKHIYQIVEQQKVTREQYPNNISQMRFNEITAAKIDYHEYFMDNDLIPKDVTEVARNFNDGKYELSEEIVKQFCDKNNVVKCPFHSASSCVFIPGNEFQKVLSKCYLEFGHIKQKYNPTLADYEFKCHVVNGDIEFIMVRVKLGDYVCVSKDFTTDDPQLIELFDVYGESIREVCKESFNLGNKLRYIKDKRIELEMSKLIFVLDQLDDESNKIIRKPITEGKYEVSFEAIFTSLLANLKTQKIKELKGRNGYGKFKEYLEMIKMTDSEFDKKYLQIGEDYPIKDYYMRIDLALPDGDNFKKVYVNEIEPFASGKSSTDVFRRYQCVEDLKGSPTSILLKKVFYSSIKKGYLEFEDVRFEQS